MISPSKLMARRRFRRASCRLAGKLHAHSLTSFIDKKAYVRLLCHNGECRRCASRSFQTDRYGGPVRLICCTLLETAVRGDVRQIGMRETDDRLLVLFDSQEETAFGIPIDVGKQVIGCLLSTAQITEYSPEGRTTAICDGRCYVLRCHWISADNVLLIDIETE